MKEIEDMLTTAQAAEILGVSTARVRQLILAGELEATKIGRDNLIKREDVESYSKNRRGPGRPADENAKYHAWRQIHEKKIDGKSIK